MFPDVPGWWEPCNNIQLTDSSNILIQHKTIALPDGVPTGNMIKHLAGWQLFC